MCSMHWATATPTSDLASARTWIDHCYAPSTIEEIVDRLDQSEESAAHRAREVIQVKSPTSLKVTLRNLREARSFQRTGGLFTAGLSDRSGLHRGS